VRVAGVTRTVVVHVPTRYSATRPQMLVLNLHGSGSTALAQELFTGMDAAADARDFVVAYPEGAIRSGSGFDWNVPDEPLFGAGPVPAGSPDDVTFLTSLVRVLERRYCIDTTRVDATGFSGGARLASQLACDAATVFAAVAPVSGLRFPAPCPTRRPVPVLSFHGTANPVDPYLGHGQAYWTYSVPVAAARWAARNRCAVHPAVTAPAAGVTLTRYLRCAAGATVALYTLAGEGHEWPDGPTLRRSLTRVLGPQTTAVDANRVIWAFFEAHPMPRRP
jgi:polyhydroxybutyrate depolymerase